MDLHTLQPVPCLAFDGKCAEAPDFYAALFGDNVVSTMTFRDKSCGMPLPDEAKRRIVNEMLQPTTEVQS